MKLAEHAGYSTPVSPTHHFFFCNEKQYLCSLMQSEEVADNMNLDTAAKDHSEE